MSSATAELFAFNLRKERRKRKNESEKGISRKTNKATLYWNYYRGFIWVVVRDLEHGHNKKPNLVSSTFWLLVPVKVIAYRLLYLRRLRLL
jgi:hypothetical protein